METLTLEELGIDKAGIVCDLRATGAMCRRFIDLGVVEGTRIECVGKSPAGDPGGDQIRAGRDAEDRAHHAVCQWVRLVDHPGKDLL